MAPFILLLAFFLALILLVIIFITYSIIWIPYKIQRQFYRQGIKGPGYHPIYGNTPEFKQEFDRTYTKPVGSFSHDIVHRLDPPYHKWTALYGKTVLFWQGIVPWIILSEPEMLKEVYLNKSGHIVRGKISPPVDLLFGQGLFNLGGDKWSLHRKVANPAFMIDQVKSWIPEVVDSVEMVVKKWEDEIEERNETEVEVMQEFRLLSSEILSRTAFGSSYGEGKHIFELEDQQAKLVLKGLRTAYIPGFRFLPTHDNRIRWKIERKIRSLITKLIINKDQEEVGNSKSLLNFLLNGGLPFEEVIDECQAFYFAGKEAVTILMTWTIVLLSMHQDWQTKAREEVFRVWKTNKEFPNADTLNDLKVVSVILNDSVSV
ncbi:OLC1v1018026C2 [Oldenlandia corymbosa var. corymbosa]|uniref:OLC1v1018026C2 n=1 Tax=Oldenlandia corymbosa var. corymbosa TaxID=529605 RepID=A0AAV1EAW5_OLDCO|nr:OLC1v1018026C2 [Oldenlandia corymbosa var. corymbosa]